MGGGGGGKGVCGAMAPFLCSPVPPPPQPWGASGRGVPARSASPPPSGPDCHSGPPSPHPRRVWGPPPPRPPLRCPPYRRSRRQPRTGRVGGEGGRWGGGKGINLFRSTSHQKRLIRTCNFSGNITVKCHGAVGRRPGEGGQLSPRAPGAASLSICETKAGCV